MHPSIAAALEPGRPGWLVRHASFLPGVATTASQIETYAAYWRDLAERAVEAGANSDGAAPGPVLVALGDSLAQGIGASEPRLGYVGRLREDVANDGIPRPVVNLSRSGAKIADVLEIQLPALAELHVPDCIVSCTVGSNDLVRSTRLGRTKRELTQLLEALPPSAVLATVPDKGSMAARILNRHLRSEADRLGVAVADVAKNLKTWRGHQAGDRFHPNDLGYGIWVDAFTAAFTSTLAAPSSRS